MTMVAPFAAVEGATIRGPALHLRTCGCTVDDAGGLHKPCPAIADAWGTARDGARDMARTVTVERSSNGFETWVLTPTGRALQQIALHVEANPPAMDLDLAQWGLL